MKSCLLGKIYDNRDLLFCFFIRLKSNFRKWKEYAYGLLYMVCDSKAQPTLNGS